MKNENNTMKIVSSQNPTRPLTDLSAWRDAFEAIDKNPRHWKEGRSACSLAQYFLSGRGEPEVVATVNGILRDDSVECLERGEIEYLCRFDTYKNPRRQDMGILGQTKGGRRLFIGVEAKVDEPFSNDTLSGAFTNAQQTKMEHPEWQALDRINGICDWFGVLPEDEDVRDLRYQLFHFTMGTAKVEHVDIRIMLLLTFHTSEYDPKKGKSNTADWKAFLNRFFVPVTSGYKLNIAKCSSPVFAVEMTVEQFAREENKR